MISLRAEVRNAELQGQAAVIRSDDRPMAEQDVGPRPREAHEQQAGGQRLIHHPHQRLDGHDQVRRQSVRPHLAVADGGEGLNAEEERLAQRGRPSISMPGPSRSSGPKATKSAAKRTFSSR